MKRHNKKQLVLIILCILWICTSVSLWSDTVNKTGKTGVIASIDINNIEIAMEKLKKKVEEIKNTPRSSGMKLKRDPFATLIPKQTPIIKETEENKTSLPDIVLYGIVSDGNTFLAIIGDEVKKEGEFVGECEIYKIKEEHILIKHRDEIFPIYIKQ